MLKLLCEDTGNLWILLYHAIIMQAVDWHPEERCNVLKAIQLVHEYSQGQTHHDSQPMSMTQMEKIFSGLVLGEMLPKPTLVRLLKVK